MLNNKSIFEEFDAILAAVDISLAKGYMNTHKGRIDPEKANNRAAEILWCDIVKELEKVKYPEELFAKMSESNSELEKILKSALEQVFNTTQLEDWEKEVIGNQGMYMADESLVSRCRAKDFSDYKDFLNACTEGHTSDEAENILRMLIKDAFVYGGNFRFYKNRKSVFQLLNKARKKGLSKTDVEKNNYPLRHTYDEIFGKNDRIILPIKVVAGEGVNVISKIVEYVEDVIPVMIRYFKAIGDEKEAAALEEFRDEMRKTDSSDFPESKDVFKTEKYEFLSRNKSVRTGKIFADILRVIKNKPEMFEPGDELEIRRVNTVYNQREVDPKEPVAVVLSRHPYDIVGMSTGRGWVSCQTIDEASWSDTVATTINAGALICYFCRESDKIKIKDSQGKVHSPNKKGIENRRKRGALDINIQNPLGRFLIKTYAYKKEPIDFENKNFLLRVSSDYGTVFSAAKEKVQKWLDDNWNNEVLERLDAKYEDFHFTKGQYFDRFDVKDFDPGV